MSDPKIILQDRFQMNSIFWESKTFIAEIIKRTCKPQSLCSCIPRKKRSSNQKFLFCRTTKHRYKLKISALHPKNRFGKKNPFLSTGRNSKTARGKIFGSKRSQRMKRLQTVENQSVTRCYPLEQNRKMLRTNHRYEKTFILGVVSHCRKIHGHK